MALRFVRFCMQGAAVADEKGQKGTNGKTGFDEWKRVCYTGGILKKEVCVMNHFHKIAAQLESNDLDAMLLTGEANRFYASGFHSSGTDGVALVTRKKAYYFTDSRYTEAAERYVQGAELREIGRGRGYAALIEEVVTEQCIRRMGFEDAYMTVQEYER